MMAELGTRMRNRLRDDRGMTLVELLVAMFVLSIVMLIFTSTLSSVQMAVVRQDNLSRTNDQARLALQEMDREIRSGQVLFDPALEKPVASGGVGSCSGCQAGFTHRVYTESNANGTASGGVGHATCVLWKVGTTSPYALQSASWTDGVLTPTPTWRTVATGVVNSAVSPPVTPFTLESGSRTLDVQFAANEDLTNRSTQTTYVQASFTGRNTSAGTPVTVCATVPTGL